MADLPTEAEVAEMRYRDKCPDGKEIPMLWLAQVMLDRERLRALVEAWAPVMEAFATCPVDGYVNPGLLNEWKRWKGKTNG